MSDDQNKRLQQFEHRLKDLREEAQRNGTVVGSGVAAAGGPMPLRNPEQMRPPGYYGLPIIKPPVWEWMIPLYFFIGGLAAMSGLLAAAAWLKGNLELARVAMWSAGIGGIVSPILLAWDLGRPMRFIFMLRVFKFQSPMSLGSWIVTGFGAFAVPGLALTEWVCRHPGSAAPIVPVLAMIAVAGSALFGIFLATYTGALIAATAVPAWNVHRVVLPFHFGTTGLGCAVAVPLLAGFNLRPLSIILTVLAASETLVMLWLELRKHGEVDSSLHHGKSGWMLRSAEALEGPLALALVVARLHLCAAAAFLVGGLLSRFAWTSAGRASAEDPRSVLASQQSRS